MLPNELSPAVRAGLLPLGKLKQYPRNKVLVDCGDRCNKLYYIQKGVVRLFYRDGDFDLTIWIASDDQFMAIPSLFFNVPGPNGVQVLEEAEIVEIDRDTLNQAYQSDPAVERCGRLLAEHHIFVFERFHLMLHTKNAADRYVDFQRYFPNLNSRIPLKYIASFLKMEQATLSRVRAGKSRRLVQP
jgi:CRP/FNR family transcriptional regulator, anaerobic regulatory protein